MREIRQNINTTDLEPRRLQRLKIGWGTLFLDLNLFNASTKKSGSFLSEVYLATPKPFGWSRRNSDINPSLPHDSSRVL